MGNVVVFYGHLEYSTIIWYILWSFGIFSGYGMLYQENSGNPAREFSFVVMLLDYFA
jgi:hypothetical protein